MTFRELAEMIAAFIAEHPDHEALDQDVVMRVQTNEANGDDLHCGALRSVSIDPGCTDTFMLVLDGDQEDDTE